MYVTRKLKERGENNMHSVWLVEIENKDIVDSKSAILKAEEMLEDFNERLYDWYEIGGRWDNEIPNNCCKGTEIKDDFIPFGIIKSDYEVLGEDNYYGTIYRMKRYGIINKATHKKYLCRMEEAIRNEVKTEMEEILKSDNYYVCVDMHD